MYLLYVWSEVQNSESQLIILSSDTRFSKPLPIPAEDHSHVAALAVQGGRQVRVEADLSQFEGEQEETHFLVGGTGGFFLYCSVAELVLHFYSI